MLLRHPWLSSLMKRPSPGSTGAEVNGQVAGEEDAEDEEDEDEEETTQEDASATSPSRPKTGQSPRQIETADQVVADWVVDALERRRKGTTRSKERPALHAVALDAVPGSPLLDDPSTISPTRK
jgi:mitogen-activated protein kinase kinase